MLRVIQNQTSISATLSQVITEVGFGNREVKIAIVEIGDAMNYIQSLSQAQREQLRLEMPRSIRDRIKFKRPKDDE
jgi:hypothetical protein